MTDPAFTTPEDIQAHREVEDQAAQRQMGQLARDYGERFGGAAGERVLGDLISHFAGVTYTRGEPEHTAYREGQRSVIEHIARRIGRAEQTEKDNEYER
jgi:hypothetical protein